MPLPLFFPTVRYVPAIDRSQAITLEQLCERAAGRCEAFGRWVQRPVVLLRAHEQAPWLKAEPGDWGAVEIGVPNRGSAQREAQWALGALAFVLFDGVARATVQGKAWHASSSRVGLRRNHDVPRPTASGNAGFDRSSAAWLPEALVFPIKHFFSSKTPKIVISFICSQCKERNS